MSVRNPPLAGYRFTGNRSNNLYVKGSTAWLYDCPQFPSPLYEADKSFDCTPLYYQVNVMYINPITRQTLIMLPLYLVIIIHQNVIALGLDTDENYVLKPKPVLRATPLLFEPKQVQTAINSNTLTAQEAGIYTNVELTNFWNRVLITKHSDNTPMIEEKPSPLTF